MYYDEYESEVRSYCRHFPVLFERAKMSNLITKDGEEYLDFFSGAGALNYGHNNEMIISAIMDYLNNDGIIHGLDMYTTAKLSFMKYFEEKILFPRKLDYKMMFCGPTGTNANEAAMKLARKYKKRNNIFTFMGAFHGMTLGSLSLTSNSQFRTGTGVAFGNATFFPYYDSLGSKLDTLEYMEMVLNDDHSGVEKPAAIFVETIQAEGGINVASNEWLRRLRHLCDKYDILLVIDDIQVGCGRTGSFFSFEGAGIVPDIVTLSKSISGSGLPMSLLLMKREIDCFEPGEHNGTFRGNQLAFVGARASIEYAINNRLWEKTKCDGIFVREYIEKNILSCSELLSCRGKGLIFGIDFGRFEDDKMAERVANECFKNKLIIEIAGRKDCVLKIMPPLIVSRDDLTMGLEIIREAIIECIK